MGFQWRRNAKGPPRPPLPPFLPTALSALFIYPWRQRRCHSSSSSSSNRSGGNLSPVVEEADPPTGRLTMRRAGARQSLAIFQTSLGHSALCRPREGERAEGQRPSVARYTRQQLCTSLDFYLGSERAGRSLVAVVRLFVGILNSAAVTHSVRRSVRVATFPRE